MKLGAWQESLEGVQEQSITQILRCYKQATDYNNSWYKAWHSWAYMNFETVLFYKNETARNSNQANKTDKTTDIIRYTVLAVEGFFRLTTRRFLGEMFLELSFLFYRSINLSKGSSLQDTLRLLTLWFEYGHWPEVHDAIVEGIRLIEKNTWLQVIPQLIARIDTPRALVSRLIHLLLIDIGKTYPQVGIIRLV